MATTAELASRIDRQLDALLAEVQDLPALAQEWDSLEEGARVSQSLDWDHLMADYLPELEDCRQAGAMTSEQERRFRALLGQLKSALPVIDRLQLSRPPLLSDAGSGTGGTRATRKKSRDDG